MRVFVTGATGFIGCAIFQELLGWRSTGPGLIQDLAQGRYFDA